MPLRVLGQFPQKADSSPQVLEVNGDAPDNIRTIVAQLRFTKIFTRWFNQVVLALEDELNVKLFEPIQLAAAAVVVYTSTSMRTNLQSVVLTNLTAGTRTVQMWVEPPNSNATDNAHQILEITVNANLTIDASSVLKGLAIENNEQLWAVCDQANAVSCRISGSKQRIGLSA